MLPKIFSPLVLVILLFVIFMVSCGGSEYTAVKFPSGRTVSCEIADSPKKLTEGLSEYEKLGENQGMIFVYSQERPSVSFWMPARMNFPIDFLFLNKDKKIVHLIRNAQPCKSNLAEDCPSYTSANKATMYVVEVVAGFCDKEGVKIGDTLEFHLP